jgi:hypothetical protein
VTVLEPVMRALTFYLDVSGDCVRRIVAVDGTVEAICRRVSNTDLMDASSRDLAIQCIKVRKHNRAATQHGATGSKGQSVPPRRPPHRRKPQALELISSRDASVTYTSGALPACLNFIVTGRDFVFKDALISAMAVVSRCCGCAPPAMPALPHARAFHPPHTARPASRLETSDDYLSPCVTHLTMLLSDGPDFITRILQCFAAMAGTLFFFPLCRRDGSHLLSFRPPPPPL